MKKRIVVVVMMILTGSLLPWIYSVRADNSFTVPSGSMSHSDEPQDGIIDKGEVVYYKAVRGRGEIVTYWEGKKTGYKRYGDYGDVILYSSMGNDSRTPIVHRVMCWVEVHANGTYSVAAYNISYAQSISISELHLTGYKPTNSGFITKGDNNMLPDQYQSGGICAQPVKVDWIRGKVTWLVEDGGDDDTPGFQFVLLFAAAFVALLLAWRQQQ